MPRSVVRVMAAVFAFAMFASGCSSGTNAETGSSEGTTSAPTQAAGSETSSGSSSSSEAAGGTFVAAVPEDFDNVDPHTGSGETAATWLSLIYETLVGVDKNAQPVPGLAKDWSISDDSLTYTFHLRDGVKFQNGRPLTSKDVKFNYERITNPDTGAVSQSALSVISEIQTPDDQTVVIKLKNPDAPLLNDLAQQGRAAIVAPESYNDQNEMTKGIGTGPYEFESYTVNDKFTMTRNPDYWGGEPNIERIEVRVIPDANARLQAVESGDIDMAWSVPPTQGFAAAKNADFKMVEVPQNRANFFGINNNTVDKRVREAMFMAVNREDIAKAGWDGYAVPTAQPFTEDSFWYIKDLKTPPEGDIAGAKSLIEQAGAQGKTIDVVQWDALGSDTEAQIVASAWEQIGLKVNIEKVDIGTLVTRASKGDYDVVYLWIGLITDPNRPYGFLESSSSRHGLVGDIKSPELDQLVAKARETTDEQQRKDLYKQALELDYNKYYGQYYTVRPKQYLALNNRVKNYTQGAYYVFYQGGGLPSASLGG